MDKRKSKIKATRDTFVHYLFASPGNEGILLSFINAVLGNAGRPLVRHVEAKNPFNPQTFISDKHSVLDVRATDDHGKIFAIEFQTTGHASFANRILYYWGRTYSLQLKEGERYKILCPVVSIALVEFLLFEELKKLHNVFYITAEGAPEYVLTEDLQIHTLELTESKLSQLPKLTESLRRWLTFFHFADKKSEAEMKVLLKNDVPLERAYGEYKRFCQSERLRAVDEAHQRYLHDYNSDIDAALEKGRLLGKTEGKAEGKIEGKAEGKIEGKAEGKAEGKIEGILEGKVLSVLSILKARHGKLPKKIQEIIYAVDNLEELDDLLVRSATCRSLKEFVDALQEEK